MIEKNSNLIIAYFLLGISAICESFGPPLFLKTIEAGIDNNITIGYFLLIGGSTTLIIAIKKKKKYHSYELNMGVVLRFIILSASWPALFLSYVYTMQKSSITETVIIVRLSAVFILFLSVYFLDEKIKSWPRIILAILFCLIGIVALNWSDINMQNFLNPAILFGLLTAFIFSINIVTYTYLGKKDDIQNAYVASISMITGGLILSTFYTLNNGFYLVSNNKQALYLLLLGFGTVSVPALLKMVAYKKAKSLSKISFIQYIVPVITMIIAYHWNNERGFNYTNIISGLLLITIGLIIIHKNIIHEEEKGNDQHQAHLKGTCVSRHTPKL